MEIIYDIEQGSPEWIDLRLGLITCSEMSCIRVNGKGLITYAYGLAYERITKESCKVFNGNQWTERGHELEIVAREMYEQKTGNKVTQASFVLNNNFGYSPDGLIFLDKDNPVGAIEIKAKQPSDQIQILIGDEIPKVHIDQLYGALLCANLEWVDFVSFCPNLPMFIKRLYRSDVEDKLNDIKTLIDSCNQLVENTINEIMEKY